MSNPDASTSENSSKGNRTPPLLSKSKSYDDWCKKIRIWQLITCINKKDQGGAILLTLEGEAEDKVLELSEDQIMELRMS